jgi:large subunit ribosomal protein L9
MKVTFLEDVPSVARVGQTRTVADGYARNYLLPRKLAVVAGSQAAAAAQGQLNKKIKQRELEDAEMAMLAEKLEGTEITIKARVGENEKLYGSVTAADIAEALGAPAGREIDKKKVELAEPIRQTGSHAVTVRLGHEITAAITVHVVSEDTAEETEAAEAVKPAKKTKAKAKKVKAEEAEAEAAPEAEVKADEAEAAAPEAPAAGAEEQATGE